LQGTYDDDLKPEQQRVIDLAVRSGAYQNANEVLDQTLEIIRERVSSTGMVCVMPRLTQK
jgi:hypothetical protein